MDKDLLLAVGPCGLRVTCREEGLPGFPLGPMGLGQLWRPWEQNAVGVRCGRVSVAQVLSI